MTEPLVSLVVSTYLGGADRLQRRASLWGVLGALRCQTFDDWEALVVHNGPLDDDEAAGLERLLAGEFGDPRVRLWVAPEAKGQWGHPWRLDGVRRTTGRCVGLANDDGWYAPVYLERMVRALDAGADLVLCDFVHDFTGAVPG